MAGILKYFIVLCIVIPARSYAMTPALQQCAVKIIEISASTAKAADRWLKEISTGKMNSLDSFLQFVSTKNGWNALFRAAQRNPHLESLLSFKSESWTQDFIIAPDIAAFQLVMTLLRAQEMSAIPLKNFQTRKAQLQIAQLRENLKWHTKNAINEKKIAALAAVNDFLNSDILNLPQFPKPLLLQSSREFRGILEEENPESLFFAISEIDADLRNDTSLDLNIEEFIRKNSEDALVRLSNPLTRLDEIYFILKMIRISKSKDSGFSKLADEWLNQFFAEDLPNRKLAHQMLSGRVASPSFNDAGIRIADALQYIRSRM